MKKSFTEIAHVLTGKEFSAVAKGFPYIIALFLGMIGACFYSAEAFEHLRATRVWEVFHSFCNIVGPVVWGLVPLTLILMYSFVKDSANKIGLGSNLCRPKIYSRIKENAPLLGILGTTIGIAFGIQALDISMGIQVAVENLIVAIANAVISTAYGLILVLFINLIVPLVNKDWDKFLDIEERLSESRDQITGQMNRIVELVEDHEVDKTTLDLYRDMGAISREIEDLSSRREELLR
jgi:hypothetical protein